MAAFVGALSGLLIGPDHHDDLRRRLPDRTERLRRGDLRRLGELPAGGGSARCSWGLLDSFSSFWASAYKDVIVFTAIIPVLLLRSLTDRQHDQDE